jgi:hypothetical protein
VRLPDGPGVLRLGLRFGCEQPAILRQLRHVVHGAVVLRRNVVRLLHGAQSRLQQHVHEREHRSEQLRRVLDHVQRRRDLSERHVQMSVGPDIVQVRVHEHAHGSEQLRHVRDRLLGFSNVHVRHLPLITRAARKNQARVRS